MKKKHSFKHTKSEISLARLQSPIPSSHSLLNPNAQIGISQTITTPLPPPPQSYLILQLPNLHVTHTGVGPMMWCV